MFHLGRCWENEVEVPRVAIYALNKSRLITLQVYNRVQ